MAHLQPTHQRNIVSVLGAPIDALTPQQALDQISSWASRKEGRYVCICNVHSVVTASRDESFMNVLNKADMATPDGAPIAWLMRWQGSNRQQRVSGPDLMLDYMARAASRGESVFLLGSTSETLAKLQANLLDLWPNLQIAGAIAPPFRPLGAEEDAEIVRQVNTSGAGTLWVSLGCPKQELWMHDHADRINAVMVGVGAAFDFHAGTIKRAPMWMRAKGLEWLHRLVSEPRRLGARYLVTNTLFLVQVLHLALSRREKTKD